TPACSPTKSRSLPGQRARSKGCSNFSLGNARTTLKGGGGSGEPTTREVVQGVRTDFAGWDSLGLGGSAAEQASHPTNPATTDSGNADAARNRRCPPWEGDGIDSTPEETARTRVHLGTGRAVCPF